MRNSKSIPPVSADDSGFHGTARDYESDIQRKDDQSRVFAWRVASLAVVVAIASLFMNGVLLSRFQPFAFLVTVDRATGETSVLRPLDHDTVEFGEMQDKHNINRFVLARERYFYPLLQHDYDTAMNLSVDQVGGEYAKLFDGDKALDKVLGAGTEYKIEILSTRLPKDEPGKAIVSFERTIRKSTATQAEPPQRFIATLSYTYKPSLLVKEAVWVANPTGFKVSSYRADPEQAGSAK